MRRIQYNERIKFEKYHVKLKEYMCTKKKKNRCKLY